ncbi:MAG: tetratricopeptide repeat protein [Parvularculaceae bacterium]
MKSNDQHDQHDLSIAGADAAAARGYDAYVDAFLAYRATLRDLFPIADAAPESALLTAPAAALHLAFEGAEGWENAKPYLRRMRAAPRPSPREAAFCDAVERWSRRDFHGALARLDDLTVRWPADLCALKWAQYHAFNLGDQTALMRLGERVRIVHDGRPYAHGLIAFALEQNHCVDEAEEEGLRAVEVALDDAWAHHAVAHVHETRGRAEDGARWLDRCAHTWDAKGVFIREHNWWHAALFRLALGAPDEALAIFDERLWGSWPEFPQEQIGAISMLWRLEMRGVDLGERWSPVVEQARVRAGEHILPFHDLHYAYALARAGAPGEADAFLDSMADHAEGLAGEAAGVWADVALPAAHGVVAVARGAHEDAAAALADIAPTLHLVGGSHAQRHLFAEASRYARARLSKAG